MKFETNVAEMGDAEVSVIVPLIVYEPSNVVWKARVIDVPAVSWSASVVVAKALSRRAFTR